MEWEQEIVGDQTIGGTETHPGSHLPDNRVVPLAVLPRDLEVDGGGQTEVEELPRHVGGLGEKVQLGISRLSRRGSSAVEVDRCSFLALSATRISPSGDPRDRGASLNTRFVPPFGSPMLSMIWSASFPRAGPRCVMFSACVKITLELLDAGAVRGPERAAELAGVDPGEEVYANHSAVEQQPPRGLRSIVPLGYMHRPERWCPKTSPHSLRDTAPIFSWRCVVTWMPSQFNLYPGGAGGPACGSLNRLWRRRSRTCSKLYLPVT